MSHILSKIRVLSNHELFKLKLVRTEDPVTVVAVLTQHAVYLGVRFDNARKDYRFNLSDFLANDDAQWSRGTHFEKTAKNIKLDLSDRENRCLVADLEGDDGGVAMEVKYNLDEVLGLVDYFHPDAKETYFRLGEKAPLRGLENKNNARRALVLCFGGGSDYLDGPNTNLLKLFELLKKDDPEHQLVYPKKEPGEGAVWYFHSNLVSGYKFLVDTYQDGDKIYIFGVSRGAYTARALAGMIHCVGLLRRDHVEHIPFAHEIYANAGRHSWWETISSYPGQLLENILPSSDHAGSTEAEYMETERIRDDEVPDDIAPSNSPPDVAPPNNPLEPDHVFLETCASMSRGGDYDPKNINPEVYKETYSTSVVIDFVGVWDTVGSVDAITQTLLYIDYNPSILVFRHALALDENRAKLVPSLWDHRKTKRHQDVREVWFRGRHSDICGGYPSSESSLNPHDRIHSKLSNISLRWMVQQCSESPSIIAFDPDGMERYRERRVLEDRPDQPDLGDYKNFKPDLSYWEDDLDQIESGAIPMPNDLRERLIYEGTAELDRLDVKHQLYGSVAVSPIWKFFKLFCPVPYIYWLKLKSRMIYCNTSVYLHISVVDFLLSRKSIGYTPAATLLGLDYGRYPQVYVYSYEGGLEEGLRSQKDVKAITAILNMRWNKPSLRTQIEEWIIKFWDRTDAFFERWSSG